MTTSVPASERTSASSRQTIRRIAVGIDGFPEGRDAAALGQLLAEASGAELMLVAVHSPALLPFPPELGYKSQLKQSQLVLREVRDSLAPGARTLTATDHSVPRGLHRVVHRHHRDLLIVGASRHAPEGHVRIGKRTRQLLCQFECALAVAPRGMHVDPGRVRVRARFRRVDCRRRRRRSPRADGRRRQGSCLCPLRSRRRNTARME